MTQTADIVIVGGGIIGASIGHHLLEADPSLKVRILESASLSGTGATSKATGGVRYQFGTLANLHLSLLSRPYFEAFHDRFQVDPMASWHGYLFVTADPERWNILRNQVQLQNRCGIPTQLLDVPDILGVCPPLASSDLIGGTFCPWDGTIEPHAILQGFLRSFQNKGGKVVTDSPVTALTFVQGDPSPCWHITTPTGHWECQTVIIAAGPYSRDVASLVGLDIPAYSYRRQVFVLDRHPDIPKDIPLTVDMDTGWYVHARTNELLIGGTDKDTAPGLEDLDVDWDLFDVVYDATVRRLPMLSETKVRYGYVGVRTLTPDHHAILGPVDTMSGLYVACGFSGHGIMHSPAVGLLMAEWVLDGTPRSWDASILSPDRFDRQELIQETAVF